MRIAAWRRPFRAGRTTRVWRTRALEAMLARRVAWAGFADVSPLPLTGAAEHVGARANARVANRSLEMICGKTSSWASRREV